ncbi:hypothetical protein CKO42_05600 [Lamprobacter modestohalophilus]|uniref:Uncharacterized protein n=1 Tax=Lamprobacter modestohalophilus TaxID=1064514 RepID=A0A9X0W6Z3_9GAMM|nr:hypothetical protein [Lamprobacter modestohalophilus]MBK1617936.1 hypothetical protein [Lamprobacter modestohalophilus]
MSTLPDRISLTAQVDRLLLEQGRLEPLELLLTLDLLAYEDYEAWRSGGRADLQGALLADPDEVAAVLQLAASHASGQGLQPSQMEYRGWGGHNSPLNLGANQRLIQACAEAFAPAEDRLQLDLFHDSTGLLIENGLRDALAARRIDDARDRVGELMRHDPRHASLQGYLRLIQAVDDGSDDDDNDAVEANLANPEKPQPSGTFDAADRLAQLDALESTARDLLGHRARDFLTGLWAGLAEKLAGIDYNPASPRLHASHAWLRAERWDAVRSAIEQEPNWRWHPDLVVLHAEAAWRRRDPISARQDWAWLCWEHPHHAEPLLVAATLPDSRLCELWSTFEDMDTALEVEEFPAWLLLHDRSAAAAVPPDRAPDDERGALYSVLHRLVSGEGNIELRRQLDDMHPAMLRLFLASCQTG